MSELDRTTKADGDETERKLCASSRVLLRVIHSHTDQLTGRSMEGQNPRAKRSECQQVC